MPVKPRDDQVNMSGASNGGPDFRAGDVDSTGSSRMLERIARTMRRALQPPAEPETENAQVDDLYHTQVPGAAFASSPSRSQEGGRRGGHTLGRRTPEGPTEHLPAAEENAAETGTAEIGNPDTAIHTNDRIHQSVMVTGVGAEAGAEAEVNARLGPESAQRTHAERAATRHTDAPHRRGRVLVNPHASPAGRPPLSPRRASTQKGKAGGTGKRSAVGMGPGMGMSIGSVMGGGMAQAPLSATKARDSPHTDGGSPQAPPPATASAPAPAPRDTSWQWGQLHWHAGLRSYGEHTTPGGTPSRQESHGQHSSTPSRSVRRMQPHRAEHSPVDRPGATGAVDAADAPKSPGRGRGGTPSVGERPLNAALARQPPVRGRTAGNRGGMAGTRGMGRSVGGMGRSLGEMGRGRGRAPNRGIGGGRGSGRRVASAAATGTREQGSMQRLRHRQDR